MMLSDRVRENAQALKKAAREAIEQAHCAGVPAYYADPARQGGIIREMPDGSCQRIKIGPDGQEVVVEELSG
jgi:hypothetical protein